MAKRHSLKKKVTSRRTHPLAEFTTPELVKELKQRSIGLLIGQMAVDEQGDTWLFESKGAKPMLNSIFGEISEKYFPELADDEGIKT